VLLLLGVPRRKRTKSKEGPIARGAEDCGVNSVTRRPLTKKKASKKKRGRRTPIPPSRLRGEKLKFSRNERGGI